MRLDLDFDLLTSQFSVSKWVPCLQSLLTGSGWWSESNGRCWFSLVHHLAGSGISVVEHSAGTITRDDNTSNIFSDSPGDSEQRNIVYTIPGNFFFIVHQFIRRFWARDIQCIICRPFLSIISLPSSRSCFWSQWSKMQLAHIGCWSWAQWRPASWLSYGRLISSIVSYLFSSWYL